jgi:hemoglobin-like flavoprotein
MLDTERKESRPMSTNPVDARARRRVAAAPSPPEHDAVIGAAALDLMAAIAGPAWTSHHEQAWSTAYEIVVRAMTAEAADEELAAAA